MRIRIVSLLYLLFLCCPLKGQFTYSIDQSIPVIDASDRELGIPWTGGINAAQFNTMDLNFDDKEDLVL